MQNVQEAHEYATCGISDKKRISVSKALLLEGEKSITDISREVGFSSPTYFGMVFKNQENVSPSQFREQFLHKL
ncbi:MAG: helix-turn-helix transcriptional regulator [Oscillospiraceae bacterium]